MSADGETITLKKFKGHASEPSYVTPEWLAQNAALVGNGVVLDIETTGLNRAVDRIIEIGLRSFTFHRETGEVLVYGGTVSQLQDPRMPLVDKVKRLTGLDDAMLAGHQINWPAVDAQLAVADIVIAHNASFDRPFVEKHSSISASKVWGCSLKQIDWDSKGFPMMKLEALGYFHGFFGESHRALNDSDFLLHFLSMPDAASGKPYLSELLQNALRPLVHMKATSSPFESKDALKDRGYGWDPVAKCWKKTLFRDALTEEISWLEVTVYKGSFRGVYQELGISDNFKE